MKMIKEIIVNPEGKCQVTYIEKTPLSEDEWI